MSSGWQVLLPEFKNELFALREKDEILSENEYCQKRGLFYPSIADLLSWFEIFRVFR